VYFHLALALLFGRVLRVCVNCSDRPSCLLHHGYMFARPALWATQRSLLQVPRRMSASGAGGAGAGGDGTATASVDGVVPHASVVLGFVGVGTMASAMVEGLCTAPATPPKSIVLSPRGKARSAALAAKYPSIVRVAASNAEVVDSSDWVVLAVLPKHAEEVFGPLSFRSDQVIINLLASSKNEHIASLVAPATTVIRSVPLPPVAVHACPTLCTPHHDGVAAMFNQLGSAVVLDHDWQRELMQGVCCMMGPYYKMLVTITTWLKRRGVPLEKSGPFVAQLFQAITLDAVHCGPKGFQSLVDEQTPGGLNEGAIRQLEEAGVWDAFNAALDNIYKRSTGRESSSAIKEDVSDAAGAE